MTTGTGRCRIETGFGVDDVRVCVCVVVDGRRGSGSGCCFAVCVDVYTLGIYTHA